jgi:hypothetical protein
MGLTSNFKGKEMGFVRAFALFGGCVCLLISGCSQVEVYPVTGTITMNGQPLQSVHVFFFPDSQAGMDSRATTDEEGKFELQTMDLKHKGAIPGVHVVALRDVHYMREYKMNPDTGEAIQVDIGETSRISWEYSTHVNSPLRFTVEPGKDNRFDIKIGPDGKVIE